VAGQPSPTTTAAVQAAAGPPSAAPQTQLVDQAGAPYVTSVSLAARSESSQNQVLYWLSALVLLAVVVAPPLIAWRRVPHRGAASLPLAAPEV
jgi:hypothetical protein